ncbi:hypothetical protein [Ureibacillus manganicus]|uniref:Transcriptional regulator n=1 Tax=Ureibacillus manganicus DSM 26584 TaxID=1384049 RepID=A0A0A3I3G6_9BACL|nr:hypothetical protein [Ureibacillus manganicus]KGR78050.1 hypothetical protein CD29_12920 [Ureibacillus manganicus DSM 26584]
MYKVGVVGPKRSVDRIVYYVEQMNTDLTFLEFPYNIVHETIDILEKHHQEVDFWLFSGNIPYTIAQQSEHFSRERMHYIHITVNSFYRGMLELSHSIGKLAKRASIDTLSVLEQDFQKEIDQLENFLNDLYIKHFEPKTSINEIIEYHADLWEKKKIDIVLTAYPTVEQALQEKGIPVYWIGPLQQDIYHTLQLFNEKIRTFYYKETQTTALILLVKNFESIKTSNDNGYAIHFLQLNLMKWVLQICEKIDGYFIDEGNGRFIIFSSRGIVERNINTIYEMLHLIEIETEQPVFVGIGHATTVFYAENAAKKAMQHVLEKGTKEIIIMGEDGIITEYNKNSPQITYTSRSQSLEIIEKLKQATISPKMYNKIEAKLSELKIDSFSAKTLAKELHMTDRNAQRILSELYAAGLVEYCGVENRNTRGRSAKIYKLIG